MNNRKGAGLIRWLELVMAGATIALIVIGAGNAGADVDGLTMVPAGPRTLAPDWRERIDDPGCLAPVVLYRKEFVWKASR